MQLKKTILNLLNVKEFSKESEFSNPIPSFIIPDVICTFCNFCRDIDLCREYDMHEDAGLLICPACNSTYNKEVIELILVDIINKRNLKYQLQDVVCKKCKLPKDDNMSGNAHIFNLSF